MEKIIQIYTCNDEFTLLVLEMREGLNSLNQIDIQISINAAREEAESNFTDNRKMFVYQLNDHWIAYSVIKIEGQVCWLDWLFVKFDHRRNSIASELFDHAEKFAKGLGNDQLYVWVHPDNQPMLKFLKKKGYDILNLIEVKKEKSNRNHKIEIFGNKFQY